MDYETVVSLFNYREDGNLIWKVKRSGTKKWKTAGAMHRNGYKVVTYKGKQYPAHRLIWLYHEGYMPEPGYEIDHINRQRDDNRIENLRVVSRQCNQRNTGNWTTSSTGVKGVVIGTGKRYRVSVRLNNKLFNVGDYNSFTEAVLARFAAEQCLNWERCDCVSPAHQYALKHKLLNPCAGQNLSDLGQNLSLTGTKEK